jgi:hypothetical protein
MVLGAHRMAEPISHQPAPRVRDRAAAGLFVVHHGVGSEEWSADGFTRLVGH